MFEVEKIQESKDLQHPKPIIRMDVCMIYIVWEVMISDVSYVYFQLFQPAKILFPIRKFGISQAHLLLDDVPRRN